MIARSLRWRLLIGAVAAILAALALAWAFMTVLFERHLVRRLEAEMTRDGLRLAAALTLGPDGAPSVGAGLTDARLDEPAGGYYWQVSTANGSVRSRSLWDAELPRDADAPADTWRLRRIEGPYAQSLLLLERAVRPDAGGPAVLVQLAQDRAPLATARGGFARELAAFLGVLWLVLSAAAWVQVRLGLAPLARIRAALAALRGSASARLPASPVREVAPLVDEINALADAREADLAVARQRAGDLAHGLKTPLAALVAQTRRAREAGADKAADGLERAIAAMRHTVEAELARARVAHLRRGAAAPTAVRPTVERLVTVLEHTDRGGELAFAIDIPGDLQLPIESADLSEILGAVLDNAVRYARRQVRVSGAVEGGGVRIAVEDDGPGIAAEDEREALVRGGRLDERVAGSGLGLAIARELADATGGAIGLSSSPLGGLKVDFRWA